MNESPGSDALLLAMGSAGTPARGAHLHMPPPRTLSLASDDRPRRARLIRRPSEPGGKNGSEPSMEFLARASTRALVDSLLNCLDLSYLSNGTE